MRGDSRRSTEPARSTDREREVPARMGEGLGDTAIADIRCTVSTLAPPTDATDRWGTAVLPSRDAVSR